MIQEALTRNPMIIYPLISLVIFGAWFTLTILWLFRKNSAEFYKKMGALAVDDEILYASNKKPEGDNVRAR